MRALRAQVMAFAPLDNPLLITGEAGTGTRRIAEFVHGRSRFRNGPLHVVDLATLSEEHLAHQLHRCQHRYCHCWLPGVSALTRNGTVVLPHVECLPAWALRRLIWVQHQYRTDSTAWEEAPPTHRVIALLTEGADAPTADDPHKPLLLNQMRTAWMPLVVPPLRERRSDLALLARHCLRQANAERGTAIQGFTAAALTALEAYPWPGNLHEFAECVGSAVQAAHHRIGLRHLGRPPWQWTPRGAAPGSTVHGARHD